MNSRTSSWRAAYQRCLRVGVDPDALTRLGRGIGGGTPSTQWNAGQAALAEFLFTLTATLVEMYPPDAARFRALAAACPEDSTLAARWLVTVLDLVETFDPVNAQRFRRSLLDALQVTPSGRNV